MAPVTGPLTGLRVAVGGVEHETNTYTTASLGHTREHDFAVWRRSGMLALAETRTSVGGALAALGGLGAEIVPTLYAEAVPSGTIEASAYSQFRRQLLEDLASSGPIDGVILVMHGAGVTEHVDDLEADLAAGVREVVGPSVPLVSPLDLHGNVSQQMADLTLPLGCHEYPHVDMYERGVEAAELLPRLVSHELEPVCHVARLPMLLPATWTGSGAGKEVNRLCEAAERRPRILDATFFHGFPWTDTSLVGASVTVTSDGDAGLAAETAEELAQWVWEHREDFRREALSPEEAVRRAAEADTSRGPVVLHETNDNAGGGAPADGTHLLRCLLEARPERACFGFLVDASAAAAAHEAGVGSVLTLELGGRSGPLSGGPLTVSARVMVLADGRFTGTSKMVEGVRFDLGPSALLDVQGVGVIVTSLRQQTFDSEIFRLHGVEVTELALVCVKSQNHFRAGFSHLASDVLTVDAPGPTTNRLELLPRSRAGRPLWPLNEPSSADV